VTQLDTYRSDLERLIDRGRRLRGSLADDPAGGRAATQSWQQECAALVNRLSGGSKAHWLARAFSQAFLLRSPAGAAIEEASQADIVGRIVDVLQQAGASLSHIGAVDPQAAPRAPQFAFVHDDALRPVLEQAYVDSRTALADGRFGVAFIYACSALEAVITDALEHSGRPRDDSQSFERRIAEAERAGLIRGGCARLPPRALTYRDLTDNDGTLRPDVMISEQEARHVGQVLRVVMRDLDPGR